MEHHTGRRFTELSVSTHDLNAAASVCDRLHVLYDGHVVASGPPREVLQPALSADVFGVRATVVDHPLTGDPLIAFDHLAPAHNPTARKARWSRPARVSLCRPRAVFWGLVPGGHTGERPRSRKVVNYERHPRD